MCGITGIIHWQSEINISDVISNMNDAIAHRGPDNAGIYTERSLGFGHRRLSIIDTSEAGNQPFFSTDRDLVIAFNGEIYNYIELKAELSKDYTFRTETDTEVILAAYKKWGITCVQHFIGMFAFVLHDVKKEEIFLVRDRLGVKPLYYAETESGFLFASEIRALLASGMVKRKLDTSALIDYLRYQTVHAPSTIVDGVKMLLPGHYMHFKGKDRIVHQYWDIKSFLKNAVVDTKENIEKNIYSLLYSAVEMRMRADVPFGAFLSGGIDSSIVVGLMSRIASQPVKTFSITFREAEFDEGHYSKLIAQRFSTDHTEIKLSANDFMKVVPEALAAMDHPSGDGPNTYMVSKVTRGAGVKMALSGLGGDELFAGYDVFKRMSTLHQKKWITKTPKGLRSIGANLLVKVKPSIAARKIAAFLKDEEIDLWSAYAITRQVWMDSEITQLLNGQQLEKNAVRLQTKGLDELDAPFLSKVSVAEIQSYMQNVLLRDADQMSMAHALEIREPFVDHRLTEYILGISDSIKFPTEPKKLLVDAVGDLIPREIVDRKKMGFTFPWPVWMRGELREFCEKGLGGIKSRKEFNAQLVEGIWEDFIQEKPGVSWARIWPMVVLGHWLINNEVND
ncbi:MAG: asparagine synthase (glutamine-hydrolyzing) [Flavobacteriales bacterium]